MTKLSHIINYVFITRVLPWRSVDRWLQRKTQLDGPSLVPRWNYLLLRIQFFIMYFVAGLKKLEPDWLWGYSMMSLGQHHAFAPFRCIYYIINFLKNKHYYQWRNSWVIGGCSPNSILFLIYFNDSINAWIYY